jgi:hypothetical protein
MQDDNVVEFKAPGVESVDMLTALASNSESGGIGTGIVTIAVQV